MRQKRGRKGYPIVSPAVKRSNGRMDTQRGETSVSSNKKRNFLREKRG